MYVRYYAKYDDRGDYHHTGMWLGGFNPPTQWPQGTAGVTPNGSDFFHNALEPQGQGLELDQYATMAGDGLLDAHTELLRKQSHARRQAERRLR